MIDSKGNPYKLATGPTDWSVGDKKAWTYYAGNIAGGGSAITITVTLPGVPTASDIYAAEYSGIAPQAPLDQFSAGTGNSATPDSGSKTPTQATELICGFGMTTGAATVNPPCTARNTFENNSSQTRPFRLQDPAMSPAHRE